MTARLRVMPRFSFGRAVFQVGAVDAAGMGVGPVRTFPTRAAADAFAASEKSASAPARARGSSPFADADLPLAAVHDTPHPHGTPSSADPSGARGPHPAHHAKEEA